MSDVRPPAAAPLFYSLGSAVLAVLILSAGRSILMPLAFAVVAVFILGTLAFALLAIADRWLGLGRVELTVFTDNARAIALYRSFGFETEGTLRGFALRDGALVDAYTMARITGR